MRPPKLLPWLARKAGVSDELAVKLWRRALQEAEALAGNRVSSDYHALCIDRFLNLLEVEAGGEARLDASPLSWIWRYPQRIALYTLIASVNISRIGPQFLRRQQTRPHAC
jgi:hypothetical protein